MGARKARNMAHVEPGLRATLDDGSESSHGSNLSVRIPGVKTTSHAGIFPGQQLDVFLEGRARP